MLIEMYIEFIAVKSVCFAHKFAVLIIQKNNEMKLLLQIMIKTTNL